MKKVLLIAMLIVAVGLVGCPRRHDGDRRDDDRSHDQDRGHDGEHRGSDNDNREHR